MPRPGRMTTERAKDFKSTLRQLIGTMGHYKLPLITAIVFAILSTIFNIAGPKVLAKATTALATGWIAKLRGTGSIDFVYIGRVLLFLLGMYLLSSAFSFIQGWLMTGLSQKVCYDFRRQISQKIDRLPLAYFEKRTVGEVLSRITNDVDTLGQSLNQSITQLITSVTTMIGVLIMMLSISPRMTLIALLILPVSLALVLLVVRFSQKYFKAQQATLGVVNGQVEEVYCRPQRGQGLQPRGRGAERLQRRQRQAVRIRLEEPVPLGPDDAHHELCGQPGLCGGGHRGQHLCRQRHHHHRRHPGLHPVRQELHPAHPAAVAGVQHAAEHGRCRRAGVRVPERAGRGPDRRPGPPGRPRLHRRSGDLRPCAASATPRTRPSSTTSAVR